MPLVWIFIPETDDLRSWLGKLVSLGYLSTDASLFLCLGVLATKASPCTVPYIFLQKRTTHQNFPTTVGRQIIPVANIGVGSWHQR